MAPDPFHHPLTGPRQIQELQEQVNYLKEEMKSLRIVNNHAPGGVLANVTAVGTELSVTPPEPTTSNTRNTWG